MNKAPTDISASGENLSGIDRAAQTLPCGRPAPVASEGSNTTRLEIWKSKLKNYLAQKGLKYSEQRWKIAELILSSGGHVDAQTLVERVREQHPGIGAATVYRSLKVLQDAHILKESLTGASGRTIFEIFDEEHHDHIVCVDCGAIFEFHNDKIETLQNSIAKDMRFAPIRHRHVMYVNCRFKPN